MQTRLHGEFTTQASNTLRAYLGFVFGETFEVQGPLGNKKFTLFTEGIVTPAAHETVVTMTMRPGTCAMSAAIVLFIFVVMGFTVL